MIGSGAVFYMVFVIIFCVVVVPLLYLITCYVCDTKIFSKYGIWINLSIAGICLLVTFSALAN